MAAGRAEFKRLMGNVAAVVLIGGVLMFTFTGCANKDAVETTAPVAVETVVEEPKEIKDTTTTSGFLDNTQETQVTEKVTEREVTVTYESSDTEADTKTVVGDEQAEFTIKDFIAPNFYDSIKEVYVLFDYSVDENALYYGKYKIADNCESDEDGRLLAKEVNLGISEYIKPVVKYLKTGDNEATAMYISTTKDENVKSGITFVFDLSDEGTVELVGMQGVFGEDITNLKSYDGKFVGWSLTSGGEVAFEAGETALVSAGLTLYPIFDYETVDSTTLDDMEVYSIAIGENGNYYIKNADGTITIKSTKTGKNVDKEVVKEVQESGKKKTDKKDTKKDKTSNKGDNKSSDESKPKPDKSGDGGTVAKDEAWESWAESTWGDIPTYDGTWTGMDDLTPGALTSDMVE